MKVITFKIKDSDHVLSDHSRDGNEIMGICLFRFRVDTGCPKKTLLREKVKTGYFMTSS